MALVMLNLLLALAAIVTATIYGEKPERRGALIIILMAIIGLLGQSIFPPRYGSVDPPRLIQDVVAFVGFSYLGINSKRIWPLWAAALQLLSVGAHFVRVLEIPVRPIVYAWMKSGPTWGVLILLIIGTIINRRRRSSQNRGRFSDN
ncbi:hypothetical protein IP79_14700 [Porphyrobacter sp. AAP60]|nr:hypothetical protein IP79_14700 [Porphyrobacter sp. AAP60]